MTSLLLFVASFMPAGEVKKPVVKCEKCVVCSVNVSCGCVQGKTCKCVKVKPVQVVPMQTITVTQPRVIYYYSAPVVVPTYTYYARPLFGGRCFGSR